jgi:hypothetical protein
VESVIDDHAMIASPAQRLSELFRSRDLSTPIPHLSRWKVRDLAAHFGGVHRWATRIVTARSMDGPSFKKSKLDGVELCDWFDAGVSDLLATIGVNEATDPCPNFNQGSMKTVAWWTRRQRA